MIRTRYILGISILLFAAVQCYLYYNEIHIKSDQWQVSFNDLEKSVQKPTLTLDDIKQHAANDYFDIIVRDKKDRLVYWNTTKTISQKRTIDNKTYFIQVAQKNKREKNPHSLFRWIATLLLFISLFSGLRLIQKKQLNRITRYSLNIGLLICSIIIAHYAYFPSWLQLPIHTLYVFSLLEIWILIFWIGFNYESITDKVQKSLKQRPMLYSAIVGLVASSGVLSIVFIIKNTILNILPINGLDTPLQYTSQGIMSCFVIVIFVFHTFYITLYSYERTNQSLSSSKKYFSLGIGILLSMPLFFLLNLQLPLLAIYAFILSYLLILDIYVEIDRKSAVFVFLWMIIFAGFMASLVFYYSYQKDMTTRSSYAKSLYSKNLEAETESIIKLDSLMRESDIFTKISGLPYPAKLDKSDFTDFLLKKFKTSLKGWNINLECFDSDGNTIFKDYYANAQATQKKRLNANRLQKHVYYNPFESSYHLDYRIENESFRSNPLQFNLQLDKTPSKKQSLFDFFIFKNKKLIEAKADDFAYDPSIISNITEEGIRDDYSYVIHRPTQDISIYVPRKMDGLIRPISLFSFLLTLMGLLLLCMASINSRFQLLPQSVDLRFNYQASLRNKIQFTIISLTIFSFIFIGLMTIFYFKNVLEQKENIAKEHELRSIINNIYSLVTSTKENVSKKNIINNELSRIAHIHQKELSFYTTDAERYNTSNPRSEQMRLPYNIWSKILHDPSAIPSHIDHERGKVAYYIPLATQSTSPFGILSVSSPRSELYSKSLLDFLSTILNVYIFLFLVAGAIAIAMSNSITRPLASLSEKLKLFKLGKKHEPLVWDTKDEIGSLIGNYNQLISKLEESANIIARTERDTAWREMAKQVAHEIKNPLTPMKLSIQHLDRISQAEGVDVSRMVKRISTTLLEQFNNLDQIANSFSNLATMPSASNQKIVVNEVVESIHDLFRKREDMEINLSEPITDLYIYADRNHLVRVLNNIVKNAIQSIPTDRKGRVDIALEQKGNNAVIKVSDNGVGIPKAMREKVFTPNFTTKSSGTGLGLAISANMIEAFNGKIYFETELNIGTDFYIEIPLMRLEDNYKGQKRVSLD